METTVHNPDRYMGDLRQILAQGRKRIGMILGAGCPASICIDPSSNIISHEGVKLIPTVEELTQKVCGKLTEEETKVVAEISKELSSSPTGASPTIEMILSRVRSLAAIIGSTSIHGYDGPKFTVLAQRICSLIGEVVSSELPSGSNAYTDLAAWIGGTHRTHAIEVFTPNYDLLFEEAFERLGIPYFDGFSGAFEPFFDPSSISNDDLPPRWARIWKLHGSLGWAENNAGGIVRCKGRQAAQLIYPDHLKYDQIQKLPFAAFFDRLRRFLTMPDTLLLTCGFSFHDAHISAVIDDALVANPAASIFAFQYNCLDEESHACDMAAKRPNMSVYAKDGAVINCIHAPWKPGDLPSPEWGVIRKSYWRTPQSGNGDVFLLGDFVSFASFFALTHAERVAIPQDPAASGDLA
ncbi:MAG: SIR2 family protein [Pseudomonadota bacterium]